MKPTPAKPRIIIAQVEGSGTVGAINPSTTAILLPPPNVENRKSPVNGSIAAPSAPFKEIRGKVVKLAALAEARARSVRGPRSDKYRIHKEAVLDKEHRWIKFEFSNLSQAALRRLSNPVGLPSPQMGSWTKSTTPRCGPRQWRQADVVNKAASKRRHCAGYG